MTTDVYAAKYVPLGYRTANPDETDARRIAQALKVPTEEAIQMAAPAMAALIDGPCWLVPVPASDGSLAPSGQPCAGPGHRRACARRSRQVRRCPRPSRRIILRPPFARPARFDRRTTRHPAHGWTHAALAGPFRG